MDNVYFLNNTGHRFVKRPNPFLQEYTADGKKVGKLFKAKYFDSGTMWQVAVKHNGDRVVRYEEVSNAS